MYVVFHAVYDIIFAPRFIDEITNDCKEIMLPLFINGRIAVFYPKTV